VKLLSIVLVLASCGCASPAADYVRADAAAWTKLDEPVAGTPTKPGQARVDIYIDMDPSLSTDEKDALHQLMNGRRARISHALAEVSK